MVKPLADAAFRSTAGLETAGIPGSSVSGLINVYGLLANASVFGFCRAFRVNYQAIR